MSGHTQRSLTVGFPEKLRAHSKEAFFPTTTSTLLWSEIYKTKHHLISIDDTNSHGRKHWFNQRLGVFKQLEINNSYPE